MYYNCYWAAPEGGQWYATRGSALITGKKIFQAASIPIFKNPVNANIIKYMIFDLSSEVIEGQKTSY